MNNKQELSLAQLKSGYMFAKEQRTRAYNNVRTALGKIQTTLQVLSAKGESDLSKKDLLDIINLMMEYMRAYSLYRYYRDSVEHFVSKLNEVK